MAISTVTSIGTPVSSLTGSPLAISGLASGMNWQTIVQELGTIERAPETQWKAQQTTIAAQNAAYTTISSDLTTLQLDAQTLLDPSFYSSVVASSSASTVATASAAASTTAGNYTFNISQLAKPAQILIFKTLTIFLMICLATCSRAGVPVPVADGVRNPSLKMKRPI